MVYSLQCQAGKMVCTSYSFPQYELMLLECAGSNTANLNAVAAAVPDQNPLPITITNTMGQCDNWLCVCPTFTYFLPLMPFDSTPLNDGNKVMFFYRPYRKALMVINVVSFPKSPLEQDPPCTERYCVSFISTIERCIQPWFSCHFRGCYGCRWTGPREWLLACRYSCKWMLS